MLAQHIRKMRTEMGMTLKELAKATNLSPGYLSQVERGLAKPSLDSLKSIADALQIPTMLMLENDSINPRTHLLRRNKQPLVTIPESTTVTYRLCSQLPSSEYMPNSLVLEFNLKPNSQDFEIPIFHDAEEIIIVTKGEITVTCMGEATDLSVGDTLILQPNVPHVIKNRSEHESTGYSIMTPAIWRLNNAGPNQSEN